MNDYFLSLLIVDDEPSIRNGLAIAVEWNEIGIEVLGVAADGNEAFSMIETLHPHIVITDIRMPNCDGLELIRKVREKDLSCHFIILSGYDDFKYAQAAIRYQVNSYLLKPIQMDDLIKEVIFLRDTTLKEIQENDSLRTTRQQLLLHNDTLRTHFCERLLDNEYKTDIEVENQINTLKIPLQNEASQVLVFHYNLVKNQDDLTNAEVLKKLLIEKIQTSFAAYPCMTVAKDMATIALIINVSTDSDLTVSKLHDCCNLLLSLLQTEKSLSIHIGIGDCVPSLLSTNTSYLSALEAVSYRIYQTQQRIFDTTALSPTAPPIISTNQKINNELINAIYSYNLDDLNQLLHDFFHSLFYVEIPPPNYIRGMCIFLMIDVQNGLSNYMDEIKQLYTDIP